MIDNNKVGKEWEDQIKQKFQKLRSTVLVLDRGQGSCVDFYVYRKSSYQGGFLCEAKSVNVVGFDDEVKAQISTRNKKFWDSVGDIKHVREHNYEHNRVENSIREQLNKALKQFNNSDLRVHKIEKEQKPFVVAIGFDFTIFPNEVNFDQLLQEHPLISAVLVLDSMQSDTKFKLCRNTSAQIQFDEDFLHRSW